MASTFFAGTSRRVTIGTPSLLGGKGKARKIRLPLIFPLSGESVVAMPDWLSEAYGAVAKFAAEMTPSVTMEADVALILDNPQPVQEANGALFKAVSAKIPSAEIRSFRVIRMGEAENPDVCLTGTLYTDFSRQFWKWLGEYAHSEVTVQFPSTKVGMVEVTPPAEQVTLSEAIAQVQEEEPTEEATGPGSEAYEAQVREAIGAPEPLTEAPRLVRHDDPEPRKRGKKNGPAELKQFHEQELAAGRVN